MSAPTRVRAELDSFQGIWEGGYYAGDPSNPLFGLYGLNSYIGVSHAISLACIRPFVDGTKRVLEIGCGRGAWTRLLLPARSVTCVDALSAEHNGFFEYVGRHPHVRYVTVDDFSLSMLEDESVDFVFSYDALCHVSFDGIAEYVESLSRVIAPGGHGIVMVADYDKYNSFVENLGATNVLNSLLPRRRVRLVSQYVLRPLLDLATAWNARKYGLRLLDKNEDTAPAPGRWYHAGTERTCDALEAQGFRLLDRDMGLDFRSPLIHFTKD